MNFLSILARVQFGDPETLAFGGKCLVSSGAMPSMSTEDLLAIYASLDKLGADMPEIAEALYSEEFVFRFLRNLPRGSVPMLEILLYENIVSLTCWMVLYIPPCYLCCSEF